MSNWLGSRTEDKMMEAFILQGSDHGKEKMKGRKTWGRDQWTIRGGDSAEGKEAGSLPTVHDGGRSEAVEAGSAPVKATTAINGADKGDKGKIDCRRLKLEGSALFDAQRCRQRRGGREDRGPRLVDSAQQQG